MPDLVRRLARARGDRRLVFSAPTPGKVDRQIAAGGLLPRGGTRGSKGAQNTEYDAGLRKLLERLKAQGLPVDDALVESRDTAVLPEDQRRIESEYPIVIEDVDAVRRRLRAGQARVGRAPGAKGAGNSTKRIRLFVRAPLWSQRDLGRYLETGVASARE